MSRENDFLSTEDLTLNRVMDLQHEIKNIQEKMSHIEQLIEKENQTEQKQSSEQIELHDKFIEQIVEFRQEIRALIAAQDETFTGTLQTITGKNQNLQEEVSNLQSDINNLQHNLSRLESGNQKKFVQFQQKVFPVLKHFNSELEGWDKKLSNLLTVINATNLEVKETRSDIKHLHRTLRASIDENKALALEQFNEAYFAHIKIPLNLHGIGSQQVSPAIIQQNFKNAKNNWQSFEDENNIEDKQNIIVANLANQYQKFLLKWCRNIILLFNFRNGNISTASYVSQLSLYFQQLKTHFSEDFIKQFKDAFLKLAKLQQFSDRTSSLFDQHELESVHYLLHAVYNVTEYLLTSCSPSPNLIVNFDPVLHNVEQMIQTYYQKYSRYEDSTLDSKTLRNWQQRREVELNYPVDPKSLPSEYTKKERKDFLNQLAALKGLIHALCTRTAEAAHHTDYYRKLPIALKKMYWEILQKILPHYVHSRQLDAKEAEYIKHYIAAYPDDSGFCINYQLRRQVWYKFLSSLIDPLPPDESKSDEGGTPPPVDLKKIHRDRILMQWIDEKGQLQRGLVKLIYQSFWQEQKYLHENGKFAKSINPKERKEAREILEQRGQRIQDGRSLVLPIYQLNRRNSFKIAPLPAAFAKIDPELPGRQNLAEDLIWRICGYGPIGTLCRFDMLFENADHPYSVYISQVSGQMRPLHADNGMTLQAVLRREGIHLLQTHNSNLQKSVENHFLHAIEDEINRDDGFNFTLNLFKILILRCGDEKFDNLALEYYIRLDGTVGLRLNSFDSERIFVDLLEFPEQFLGKATKIGIKSIFLCMEQMKKPLNAEAIQRFCALNAAVLLTDWLITQDILDQKNVERPTYKHLFKPLFSLKEMHFLSQRSQTAGKATRTASHLPAILDPGIFPELYQKITKLQTILSETLNTEIPTGLELISIMHPHWASFYQKSFQCANSTPARFDLLPTDYIFDEEPLTTSPVHASATQQLPSIRPVSVNMRSFPQVRAVSTARYSASVRDTKQILEIQQLILDNKIQYPAQELSVAGILQPVYTKTATVLQAFMEGDIKPFLDLEENYIKERVLNSLVFRDMLASDNINETKLSDLLMQAFANGEYQEIRLRDCKVVTDNHLNQLFKKSKQLYLLEINRCPQISEDLIQNLPKLAPYLHRLKLINLPQLRYFSRSMRGFDLGPLVFPYLKQLVLQHCEKLQTIHLQTTEPVDLILEGCDLLQSLTLKPLLPGDEKKSDSKQYPGFVETIIIFDENPYKRSSQLASLFRQGLVVKKNLLKADALCRTIPWDQRYIDTLQGRIKCFTELADGMLATGGTWDGGIKLWRMEKGKYRCISTVGSSSGSWNSLGFTKSGYVDFLLELRSGVLVSIEFGLINSENDIENEIRLWRRETKGFTEIESWIEHIFVYQNLVCFTELKNNMFAFVSQEGIIKIIKSRRNVAFTIHSQKDVICLTELKNEWIASGLIDGMIEFWEKENEEYKSKMILNGHELAVTCLRELSNEVLVSGSNDKTIKFWEKEEGKYKCKATLNEHKAAVTCLTELSNGMLASGSVDGAIKLWGKEEGKFKCKVTLNDGNYVRSLLQLRNGCLASGSFGEIKLWEVGGLVLEHKPQENNDVSLMSENFSKANCLESKEPHLMQSLEQISQQNSDSEQKSLIPLSDLTEKSVAQLQQSNTQFSQARSSQILMPAPTTISAFNQTTPVDNNNDAAVISDKKDGSPLSSCGQTNG